MFDLEMESKAGYIFTLFEALPAQWTYMSFLLSVYLHFILHGDLFRVFSLRGKRNLQIID